MTVKSKPRVKTSASLVEVKKKSKPAKVKVNNRSKQRVIKEKNNKQLTDSDIMSIIERLQKVRKK